MDFARGSTTTKLKVSVRPARRERGTKVWFKPDDTIFTELQYDYATLAARLRELSFLNKGVTITLTDEREGRRRRRRSTRRAASRRWCSSSTRAGSRSTAR
jgi:DNA gyrase/topoisomerase IV subunit B